MGPKHWSEKRGIIKRSLRLRGQMGENKRWCKMKWWFMDKQTCQKMSSSSSSKSACHHALLEHFIRNTCTPTHSCIGSANHVVAVQYIKPCRYRSEALVNVHITHQNKMGGKMWSQWLCLWHDCWWRAGWFEYFCNQWPPGNFRYNSP